MDAPLLLAAKFTGVMEAPTNKYHGDKSRTFSMEYICTVGTIGSNGADRVTRTPDPRITNALLYQLSYIGTPGSKFMNAVFDRKQFYKNSCINSERQILD